MFKNLRDRLKKVQDDLEESLDAQLEAQLEAELAEAVQSERPSDVPAEAVANDGTAEPELEETPTEPEAVEVVQETEEAVEESEQETESEEPVTVSAPEPQPEPAAVPVETAPPASATKAEPQPKPAKEIVTGRKRIEDQELERRIARELGEAVEVQKEVERTVGPSKVTKYTINEDVLEDILWELEVALLESDVALPVIEAIKENIKDQLLTMQVGGKSPAEVVEKVLRSAILRVLSGQTMDFDAELRRRMDAGKSPVVVMFVGVNGTGKTTTIARIAHRLQGQGLGCVLAAGDTFRAGAIEQLTQHADTLGVKVIKHAAGGDPAAVAYDAIEHAKARNKPVVLLDTAGRMQTNTNLMDEMDKIRRVAKPDIVLFVGDSLAGNDAVEQARRFDEVVDIDGAVLTKVDVDAKGGAALSVAYTINKPLVFVGVGQGYDDLKPFDAKWLVDRLFGSEG